MFIPLKFITQSVKLENGQEETGILTDATRMGGRYGHGGGIIAADDADSNVTHSIASSIRLKQSVNEDGSWHVELQPQVPLRLWLLGDKDEPLASPLFHYNPLIGYNFGVSPDHYEEHVSDQVYTNVANQVVDSIYDIQTYTTATLDVKPDKHRGWHVAVGFALGSSRNDGALIVLQDMDPSAVPETGNWFNVADGTRVILLGVMIGFPCDEHGAHARWIPWAEWVENMPGPDGKRRRRDGILGIIDRLTEARASLGPDAVPAGLDIPGADKVVH